MALGTWGKIGLAFGLMFGAAATTASAEELAMRTGARTSQPIGHYEFCRSYPSECRFTGARPAALSLNSSTWSALTRVNAQVNRSFSAMTDMDMWGKEEVWSYPTRAADCEDFVLEKRRRLMAMGIAAGNLLITVLRQPNGDGHAVLTVRTTRGDYLLDNLDGQIRLWSNTNYIFLKRQSEANAGVWLSINDGRDPTVASVR
jgi:predicted transglutaminase-like cysteine proteinase